MKSEIIIFLLVLIQTNLKAQTPTVLQSINYEQQGDLTRFYGVSLRKEGLTTVDNQPGNWASNYRTWADALSHSSEICLYLLVYPPAA